MTTGGGLAIGIFKLVLGVYPADKKPKTKRLYFPDKPRGMFSEVKDLHVDPWEAPGIFIASMMSLMAGATVGPEAALSTLGGGLGTMIGQLRGLNQEEQYMSTLVGMAGAMGALFRCPLLSVMVLHELTIVAGHIPNHMENTILTGIAAVAGWAVYSAMTHAGYTFLPESNLPLAVYDLLCLPSADDDLTVEIDDWLELDDYEKSLINYKSIAVDKWNDAICKGTYNEIWILYAAGMGVLGGVLAFVHLITIGIFRQVGERIKLRLRKRFKSRKIAAMLLPMIGGLLIGLIAKEFPLTIGDGTLQLTPMLKATLSQENAIGTPALMGTLFMNMLAAGVSQGFGFIGGQIFPTVQPLACAQMGRNLLDSSWTVGIHRFLKAPSWACFCKYGSIHMAATTFRLSLQFPA